MFDYFKDIKNEVQGIDTNQLEQQKKEKLEAKRRNYFIFSTRIKILIIIMGIIYLVIAGASINLMKNIEGNIFIILKFIILSLIDFIACICIVINKKKAEIIALILIVIFIVTNYFSTIFI